MRKIIKVRLEEVLAEAFREYVKENDITQQKFLEEFILVALKAAGKI